MHANANVCGRVPPQQLLAISLTHPILDSPYWSSVVDVVEQRLLTPVGLRSLSPDHADYNARYDGNLRPRCRLSPGDGVGRLIGPYIDAWMKVHPDDPAGARRFLSGFDQHLNEGCIGSISEIFDAEAPFTPPRLYCASLERGGSFALLGENHSRSS